LGHGVCSHVIRVCGSATFQPGPQRLASGSSRKVSHYLVGLAHRAQDEKILISTAQCNAMGDMTLKQLHGGQRRDGARESLAKPHISNSEGYMREQAVHFFFLCILGLDI
jgi:hypothetical protein